MTQSTKLEEIEVLISEELKMGERLDQDIEKEIEVLFRLLYIQNEILIYHCEEKSRRLWSLQSVYYNMRYEPYKHVEDLEERMDLIQKLDEARVGLDELVRQSVHNKIVQDFKRNPERYNKKIDDLNAKIDEVNLENTRLADEIAKKKVEYEKVKDRADRITLLAREVGETSSDRLAALKACFSYGLTGFKTDLSKCADYFKMIQVPDSDDLPLVMREKRRCNELSYELEAQIQNDLELLEQNWLIVSGGLNRAAVYYQNQLKRGIPEEVDIVGQYCDTKDLIKSDPEGALDGFAKVVWMQPEKGIWGFKALRQTVKLYHNLGKYEEMMGAYKEMLTYIKASITEEYTAHGINSVMDFVAGSATLEDVLLQEFYETTLKALEGARNGRLWFRAVIELCKIWFRMREYGQMSKISKQLHEYCQEDEGEDDKVKEAQLLEVCALELQMLAAMKNSETVKR